MAENTEPDLPAKLRGRDPVHISVNKDLAESHAICDANDVTEPPAAGDNDAGGYKPRELTIAEAQLQNPILNKPTKNPHLYKWLSGPTGLALVEENEVIVSEKIKALDARRRARQMARRPVETKEQKTRAAKDYNALMAVQLSP
jgi:hypothetical protein